MSISEMKQEPDVDIYDIWVEQKPVHDSDISQKPVDETAKGKHEWVGLTEDEVMNIWYQNGFECMIYAKAIEAKLKEKNVPQP